MGRRLSVFGAICFSTLLFACSGPPGGDDGGTDAADRDSTTGDTAPRDTTGDTESAVDGGGDDAAADDTSASDSSEDSGVDTTSEDTTGDVSADDASTDSTTVDTASMDTSSTDTASTDTNGGGDTGNCVPDCTNKECGDDGCGGSCGSCQSGQNCSSNQCVWPSVSLRNDVMPIFNNYGCAARNCHDQATSQRSLDLHDASAAHNNLVGVQSVNCTNRLRVKKGAPSKSHLINKLTGQNLCGGQQMPSGSGQLTSSEIDTIRAWIGNGAPDN